jgi:hypothetical protein
MDLLGMTNAIALQQSAAKFSLKNGDLARVEWFVERMAE